MRLALKWRYRMPTPTILSSLPCHGGRLVGQDQWGLTQMAQSPPRVATATKQSSRMGGRQEREESGRELEERP